MRAPTQLPLDLDIPTRHSRDDLLVTRANAQAVSLIDSWPNWHGPIGVLVGPSGSGKSHLASIWRHQANAYQATMQNLTSIGVEKADHQSILLEIGEGDALDQTGLFHIINGVRSSGHCLLMTARQAPSLWNVTLPDLQSRLRIATLVEIEQPDDLLLEGVITKLFADRQVTVEPDVVAYLACRIERSLARANQIVQRIDAMALQAKAKITKPLVKAVLETIQNNDE